MRHPEVTARAIRRIVLDRSRRANVGHVGSSLSVAEILAALYGEVLRVPEPGHPDRDRFVLSKGHAALALYAALHLRGWIDGAALDRFCADGSTLGVHPDHRVPGIDFSTGSLGHGLAYGAGSALAARLDGSARRAFVLVSDAELNEGSLWETVQFAAHHRLGHLVAILDANGQQALGFTREVIALEPVADRWRAWGWQVLEVDGHDVGAIAAALEPEAPSSPPRLVVARTVFGKGVSFMESRIHWHYWPMSEAEYERAVAEVEGRP